LLGALLPLAAGCNGAGEAEAARSVVTAEVEVGDLLIAVEATGNVEPIRDVEVKSKASGEILQLHVDVGDVVEPGALLAEIDPRDVRNGYEQAEADLQVARARLEISKAQLDRSSELLDAGVITQQDFEARNLDYANAQAQLVRSETNFELAELRLEDVRIRAPMAGTIIQRNVEEGTVIQSASQNVSGGTTLMVMANLDQMQVRTLVDETDMGEIRADMETSVQVEAYPDRTFQGYVEKVEPQAVVQQNVTMFPVIVRLDNRQGFLRPGMNAEVQIEIAMANEVLLLANGAVVRMQDAGPAALVLGLDPEQMDFGSMMGRRRGGGGGAERPTPEASGEEPAEPASTEAAADTATDPRAAIAELRQRVQRGELSQDSMRVIMRERFGGAAGGFGDGGRPGSSQFGGQSRGEGRPQGERRTQRAFAFVVAPDGSIEPRMITTGLSDWDYTQVISGLEAGEQVAIVGAAQLQARQQEFINMMRGGSSLFGGSSRGGPPRR
jgi:HlyD family secretion protein